MAEIIPKETLQWKLKLLKSGSSYANSRLHAVKAEVLVLASGKDNMLPSGDEAKRLGRTLKNCRVRIFKDNGHTLLLEDNISLLTAIKATSMYRKSTRHDYITDFLPPSISEFNYAFNKVNGLLRLVTSPVMFSTLENGKVVRGLAGVPSEGPVLLVGYHMLMGLEIGSFLEGFLREKKILVRGVAHPQLFSRKFENLSSEISYYDLVKVFGGLPVSASNFFKLFKQKSHVLLFPGGAREALHRKGEAYKLFWPEQPEFVRMAARFGATIVPFGVVGEDDVLELVLDYDDMMNIPILNDYIKESNRETKNVRADMRGEVANQDLFLPGVLPKVPGRFYYLFGKPIETKGREALLKDRNNANDLYLQIKSEVEQSIAYLKKKRREDPYRGFIDRMVYRALNAPLDQVPSFDS